MKNISTFSICALCAVPALVQPAVGQEEKMSAEAERFMSIFAQGLECTTQFATILKSIESKSLSPAEGIKQITALTDKYIQLGVDIKLLYEVLTEEDMEIIGQIMIDPRVMQVMHDLGKNMEALQAKLESVNYYENPELKAAAERYFVAFFSE